MRDSATGIVEQTVRWNANQDTAKIAAALACPRLFPRDHNLSALVGRGDGNGNADGCDIENGTREDINRNGIPDEGDLARGDLNLDMTCKVTTARIKDHKIAHRGRER